MLDRQGDNADVRYDFNVVNAENGESVVIPNCFQCHAQFFNGQLILGLGNSIGDFTKDQKLSGFQKMALSYLKLKPKKYEAAKDFVTVGLEIGDELFTDVVGANPADRLTALLVTHRDPVTLAWTDTPSVQLPKQDNGFGRGDFGKFLMGAALLTTKDTVHAREVDEHMPDVLSYLYSVAPPKYPLPINDQLARQGKIIFENTCTGCHGTYGNGDQYPNLLIPESIIGTDSLLNKSNYQHSDMIDWYNKSWFSKGDHPAQLAPFNGYIAPPLDGVWITAPYFHNGSVPTIEAVLNSRLRPKYWTRDFFTGTSPGENTKYDYEKLGWQFETLSAPGNKYIYNTTLPGYGNYGHTFGDYLTEAERKAVIEYLKTL